MSRRKKNPLEISHVYTLYASTLNDNSTWFSRYILWVVFFFPLCRFLVAIAWFYVIYVHVHGVISPVVSYILYFYFPTIDWFIILNCSSADFEANTLFLFFALIIKKVNEWKINLILQFSLIRAPSVVTSCTRASFFFFNVFLAFFPYTFVRISHTPIQRFTKIRNCLFITNAARSAP